MSIASMVIAVIRWLIITRLPDGAYGASETDDTGYFWTSLDGAGDGIPGYCYRGIT